MRYALTLAALLFAVAALLLCFDLPGTPAAVTPEPVAAADRANSPAAASTEAVHEFCGSCHAYPPPDSFPRARWREEVRQAYDFFRDSGQRGAAPDFEAVVRYYEERAPLELPPPQKLALAAGALPVTLRPAGWSPPGRPAVPGVANVHLAPLSRPDRLDLIVCHNNPGRVWAVRPYEDPPSWHLLGEVLGPCHVDVVDFDGDGRPDLLVADLGSFYPIDHHTGRVVWLRNEGEGRFRPITLLEGVGRVADVRAADFNGDGKLDLVVGVFGWRHGQVLYLENTTTDWDHPTFRRTVLDGRAGAIHVPVGDLNNDGHPDIVALLAQEYETVVAFLNDGKGHFTKHTLYAGPHPAYGSSGIDLVDLDGDGDLDVLYTNGDNLDPPAVLKPYHGIQWLENRGQFPFVHHPITAQYGVMRAVAVDVDGDGLKDIVSVSFLPPEQFPTAAAMESVQVLRQVAPGRFERHVLETGTCDHLTCTAGDVFGDGRVHLVTGSYFLSPAHARGDLVTVWKNLGSKSKSARPR